MRSHPRQFVCPCLPPVGRYLPGDPYYRSIHNRKLGAAMASVSRRIFGFTLIELMVTLAVFAILTLLAVPSFVSFRQRSALRGATEQVQSFWNQARFEAAKRNQMVKVGVKQNAGNFCLGAATTTLKTDTTPCDCLSVAPTTDICDVAIFPAPDASFSGQSEWRGATFVVVSGTTPTLGGANNSVAVIEPKRAGLATPAQSGTLTFAGPSGQKAYKVNLNIDQLGRAQLCESSSAVDKMSDYANRSCSP